MGPKKDSALDQVQKHLQKVPSIADILGRAIRQGIDDVVQGPRTGRWNIEALQKTEKSYIGTRVEIEVLAQLGLERGKKLDYVIAGHEVDAKFSISFGKWMIPGEAVNEVCLLLAANDAKHLFWAGLLRTTPDLLTRGTNQDGKRSVTAAARVNIRWLVERGALPQNFFMHELEKNVRDSIFSQPPGQARVNELFRQCEGRVIPGSAIVAAGTEVDDAARRVALAVQELDEMEILIGDDKAAQQRANGMGITLVPGRYMAIKKPSKP